jgi:hypothetical protein
MAGIPWGGEQGATVSVTIDLYVFFSQNVLNEPE